MPILLLTDPPTTNNQEPFKLKQNKTMTASLEISMYPLTSQYGTPILQFIERLSAYEELEVHTNTMSTQVFGPYDILLTALHKEMKTSFEEKQDVVMVMKIANLDLKP